MIVKHFCNAFNLIKTGKSTIVCDPWVGEAAQTSWISYPVHKDGGKILNEINPNFIYISHLHCDHFDRITLSQCKNKNVKIIIKQFKIPILKKRIIDLGFKNIMECQPWKKYRLNDDISISIIPQMSSNNSGLEEQINYDLDTSIVIQSNKTKDVFYNGVDNPLTSKDYKFVKKFISKNFNKKIAVTVLQDGAAGEYPHCFLNIDRKKAKNKVIKASLVSLREKIKILKPEAYFSPAPGAIISGKFSQLNDLVAKPSLKNVKKILKNEPTIPLNISGGGIATKNKEKWIVKEPNYNFTQKEIIKKFSKKKYFYAEKANNVNIKILNEVFLKALNNYYERVAKYPIKTSWKVEFSIYKNLSLNTSKKIDFKNSKFVKDYYMEFNTSKKKSKKNFTLLRCHLDQSLFYALLAKKKEANWNHALSGTLILYDRIPDRFDPNLLFSLNFLTI